MAAKRSRTTRHNHVILTALSDCARGEPLTTARPYGLIPLRNKELVKHQLERLHGVTEVMILHRGKGRAVKEALGSAYGHIRIAYLDAGDRTALEQALPGSLIIPGDLLFELAEHAAGLLVTTADGSEEEAATKALLIGLGLEPPLLEIRAQRVNYPWEALDANQELLKSVKRNIAPGAALDPGVTITGEVVICQGTAVRAGSVIEGPAVIGDGCEIGPMAHIRPETSVGDGCRIGKTELVDCILMKGTTSKHHAYLGHSVLGEDVNVGAFTVTADYRHDGKTHVTRVRGEKVDTKRKKLGAFIGDHARIAVSTSFYPGRKLKAHGTTLPGEIIREDRLD